VLQCVAMCCSVLQCVAVYCSVLQCVAVWFEVDLMCSRSFLFQSYLPVHCGMCACEKQNIWRENSEIQSGKGALSV